MPAGSVLQAELAGEVASPRELRASTRELRLPARERCLPVGRFVRVVGGRPYLPYMTYSLQADGVVVFVGVCCYVLPSSPPRPLSYPGVVALEFQERMNLCSPLCREERRVACWLEGASGACGRCGFATGVAPAAREGCLPVWEGQAELAGVACTHAGVVASPRELRLRRGRGACRLEGDLNFLTFSLPTFLPSYLPRSLRFFACVHLHIALLLADASGI